MAQKPIREFDAKSMLATNWQEFIGESFVNPGRLAQVGPDTDLNDLPNHIDWLKTERLVVKPDMIMGKRGKHGLILLDGGWDDAKKWLEEKRGSDATIGEVTGELTHFLIEPFVKAKKEYYVAISSKRDGDEILFSTEGGIDIEDKMKEGKVTEILVPILDNIDDVDIEAKLLADLGELKPKMGAFIKGLFKYYQELGYAFLEINPFVVQGDNLIPLDLKCRIDDTAVFEAGKYWGDVSFPAPFGRKLSDEEKYIKLLDGKSGASLKLTILNPKGNIWTMVAGGGASVIYTDTIADLGYAGELANYGEYSGNPSTDETYEYAKTIIEMMTREKNPDGSPKFLIIGGGIANFTDVAKTFTGINKAMVDYKDKLLETPVWIYVRRGGPNYQEGLKNIRDTGESIGVPIKVFGPETVLTKIVSMAFDDVKGGASSGSTGSQPAPQEEVS
jgi:ATP-citrate lyase beta-subunit